MTTLSITQFDIKDGLRGHSCGCPISIAGGRVLKPEYELAVYVTHASVRLKGKPTGVAEVKLPPEAQRLAFDFDRSKKVEPIEFQVEIPEQYLRAA